MGALGQVIQAIKETKRGVVVRVVKAAIRAGENVLADVYAPAGDDSPPLPDDLGFFIGNSRTGGRVYLGAIDQLNEPEAEPGERRLYARDTDGNIVATVWIKGDGTLELNGAADYAVAFDDLKIAFDQLKSDLNAHVHTNPEGGDVGPAAPQSTADMSGAKVTEVRLP